MHMYILTHFRQDKNRITDFETSRLIRRMVVYSKHFNQHVDHFRFTPQVMKNSKILYIYVYDISNSNSVFPKTGYN